MTLKLVKNPVETLNEEMTSKLLIMIKAWEKADAAFFQSMIDSKRELEGHQWPDGGSKVSENRVTVNLAFASFKSAVPFIFFKEPNVRTRPKNPMHMGKEQLWDGIFNGTMPLIDYAKQKRMQVDDAWVYGEGWAKWVFSPREEENGQAQSSGQKLSEVPRGPAKWSGKGLPVSIRVPPISVIVDAQARGRDPDEARAIAIKLLRPLEELLADDRYNIDEKRINKNKVLGSKEKVPSDYQDEVRAKLDDLLAIEHTGGQARNTGEEMATIYEVWVYQLVGFNLYRQLVVLMEGYPVPIMQPKDWKEFVGDKFPGWPIRKVEFNSIPDSLPLSSLKVTEDLRKVFNWTISKFVNHLDNLNNVRTVNTAALKHPKKAMRQLRDGKSLQYIEVTEADAIANLPQSMISADMYQLLGIVEGLIDRTGSSSKNRAGQMNARTATEANIVEEAQQTMDEDTVTVMKKFLIEDLEQLGHMLQRTLSKDQLIRIAGDTGAVDFDTTDNTDLDDIPEIEIDIDSFRKLSIQEKLQPWMTMWQLGLQGLQVMPDLRLDIVMGRIAQTLGIDPGLIVGNMEDQRLSELMDILTIVQMASESEDEEGLPLPEDANPVVRLQMLEFFMTTDVYARMGQGIQALIQNRKLMMEEMIGQLQQQSASSGSGGDAANMGENPLDALINKAGSQDPATRARSQTQQKIQQGPGAPSNQGVPV